MSEIQNFRTILIDWAEWDQTYNYVESRDETFIEENFVADSYNLLNFDYAMILDENLDIAYDGYYDGKNLISIDQTLIGVLKGYQGNSGLIRLGDDTVLYVSTPIKTSDGMSEDKGVLIFARIMDEEQLEKLRYHLNHDFTIQADIIEKPLESDNPYGIMSELKHFEGDYSEAILWLPLLDGKTYYSMTFKLKNRVQILGNENIRRNIISLVMVMVIFGVLLDLALKHLVINRVIRLNDQINEIESLDKLDSRVSVNGGDEIAELAYSINEMLDEIDDMHRQVVKYADYDSMTGALSRKKGFDLLERDFEDAKSDKLDLTVVYFDVDGLKRINDSFGHSMGDKLITDAVHLIRNMTDENSYIIRLGGDEFLLVLRNSDEESAKDLIDELFGNINMFNKTISRPYIISLSYGVSEYKEHKHLDDLVEAADNSMYTFKRYRKQTRDYELLDKENS
nr:diguanylate cyclase [Acidaminobacter sp. JC074]